MNFNHNNNMAEFPYSMSVGRMQQFFKDIPSMGVPDKVVVKTLEARGFKSTNDRTIVPTLRFLDLIDASNVPTNSWRALRDRDNYGRVMAALIRQAYSGLYSIYEDAHLRSEKEIHNYMSANTSGADRMVGAMVGVFKMLCSLADFQSEPVSPDEVAANRPSTDRLDRGTQRLSPQKNTVEANGVAVQLNLTIPADASDEQIESIFKYAAKYLLGRDVN